MDEERIERLCEARLAWWRLKSWNPEDEERADRLFLEFNRMYVTASPRERREVARRTDGHILMSFGREGKSPEALAY